MTTAHLSTDVQRNWSLKGCTRSWNMIRLIHCFRCKVFRSTEYRELFLAKLLLWERQQVTRELLVAQDPTSNTRRLGCSLSTDRAPGSGIASIRSCIMIIPRSLCGDKIPDPSTKISSRVPRQPRVYMDYECMTPQRLHPPLCNMCRQRVFCRWT